LVDRRVDDAPRRAGFFKVRGNGDGVSQLSGEFLKPIDSARYDRDPGTSTIEYLSEATSQTGTGSRDENPLTFQREEGIGVRNKFLV
jgi:hypothetical protein